MEVQEGGIQGNGSALGRSKDQLSSGVGAMAVKVMTDSKQQTSTIWAVSRENWC